MKKLFSIIVIVALFQPGTAIGGIVEEFEWDEIEAEGIRKKHLCYHRALTSQWKDWTQQAVAEWNKHRSETGWEFEFVPFTTDRCEIFVISRDIDESIFHGLEWTYFDTLSGKNTAPNGQASAAVITVDSNLEITKEWISETEDVTDGSRDGWSTQINEGTRDPIDTLIHALGHSLRIGHSSDYTIWEPSNDLTNPRKNGEHYHQLSKLDIKLAKDSASADQEVQVFEVGIATEVVSAEYVDVQIPSYGLGYVNRGYEFRILDATNIAPQPLTVPKNASHVFFATGLYTDGVFNDEMEVTIQYDEKKLEASDKPLIFADGFYAPGLHEETISVVKFQKESWDLTPLNISENPSEWIELEDFDVDTDENTVSFLVDEPGLYGLVAEADPDQPSKNTEYTTVVNGKVLGIEGIEQRIFYRNLRAAVIEQLPAFGIGLVVGLFVMAIARRSQRSRKKRDRHSVPDIHGLE